MYCSRCGSVLRDDDRFCAKCGTTAPAVPPGSDDYGPPAQVRHGCLTALLVVMGIATGLTALVNVFGREWIARNLPNAPSWAQTGMIVMGLLGVLLLTSIVALWYWKRWGLYLAVLAGLGTFGLNLALGINIAQAFLGLVGIGLLGGFVLKQWRDFA